MTFSWFTPLSASQTSLNQHQLLIYNLSSSKPYKIENFIILLMISLLIEWASSEREIHLVCRSTRSLIITVDLCSLYHFPQIEILIFFVLVQFMKLSTTVDLSLLLSQLPDLSINYPIPWFENFSSSRHVQLVECFSVVDIALCRYHPFKVSLFNGLHKYKNLILPCISDPWNLFPPFIFIILNLNSINDNQKTSMSV